LLLASKPGKWKIGPAEIIVDKKKYQSNPFTVEVLDKKQQDPTEFSVGKNLFIVAEIDTSLAYIGQQLILTYTVYTTVDLESFSTISESPYLGFFAQNIDYGRTPVIKKVINGVQFSTKELRRIALFPQKSGKIEIEPAVFRVGIGKSDPFFGSLFSRYDVKYQTITTNSLNITVVDPYQNAPANFSGAVGNFLASFSVSDQEISTEDALILRINLRGDGDIKTIRPDYFNTELPLEVYDIKVKEERFIQSSKSIRTLKNLEYLFIPTQAGQFRLKPEFTYFSPDSSRYITIIDSFNLTIKQGKNLISPNLPDDELAEYQTLINPEISLEKKSIVWAGRPVYWLGVSIPCLAWVFFSFYTANVEKRKLSRIPINPLEQLLQDLSSFDQKSQAAEIYEGIAIHWKKFLSRQLSVEMAEFSLQEIRLKLLERSIHQKLIENIIGLLQTCDMALYANFGNKEKAVELLEEAKSLVGEWNQTNP